MDLAKQLSIFVFLLCVLISLRKQRGETDSPVLNLEASRRNLGGDESQSHGLHHARLEYDFYRESCPSAEKLIREAYREFYAVNMSIAPQLLRLAFHDCFIMGCDASILLDSDGNIKSEKETVPNLSIKGFEQIDVIKSRLEEECPGVVSCADIVALAARDSVLVAGGPFYPVLTGRLDSKMAFPQNAAVELPSPMLDARRALGAFAAKGFDARETIALLGGGHSTGKVHCNFIRDRLFNFTDAKGPDPSINAEFLEVLRSECSHPSPSAPSASPSPSSIQKSSPTPSFEDRAMNMDYEGVGKGFGEVYYRSVLQGKGLLFVDQQLTSDAETKAMVESYIEDIPQFRRDFAPAMMKLTHTQGFTEGEVRRNCRKVNKVV